MDFSSNHRPDDMARINTPELADAFIEEAVEAMRAQVGDGKVLLALRVALTPVWWRRF